MLIERLADLVQQADLFDAFDRFHVDSDTILIWVISFFTFLSNIAFPTRNATENVKLVPPPADTLRPALRRELPS